MNSRLSWVKNTQNNSWFDLLRLNVDSSYFNNLYGVYVIWYVAPGKSKVIKIGYGHIGEKLKAEKSNLNILRYTQLGQLKVTWATVGKDSAPGILSYLNDFYTPISTDPINYSAEKIIVNRIGE